MANILESPRGGAAHRSGWPTKPEPRLNEMEGRKKTLGTEEKARESHTQSPPSMRAALFLHRWHRVVASPDDRVQGSWERLEDFLTNPCWIWHSSPPGSSGHLQNSFRDPPRSDILAQFALDILGHPWISHPSAGGMQSHLAIASTALCMKHPWLHETLTAAVSTALCL